MQKRRANVRPLIAELNDALSDRDRKIAELQSLIAELNDALSDRNRKIVELESRIAAKDKEIERLRVQKRAKEFRTAFGDPIGSALPTFALLAGEDLKRIDRVEEDVGGAPLFQCASLLTDMYSRFLRK